jgi:PAS domain S-box-containing protein
MADAFTGALISVMAQSTEPMVLSDPYLPDHPVIAANPAFEAMSGYRADEIIGRNCRFMQGAGTDPESVRRIHSTLAASQGCIEWIVNHRKTGEPFWNLLFISPISGPDGVLRYFFGNQLDITTGPPPWLTGFQLGPAHMPPAAQQDFQALVAEIATDAAATGQDTASQARALEQAIRAARRLSELTTALEPSER